MLNIQESGLTRHRPGYGQFYGGQPVKGLGVVVHYGLCLIELANAPFSGDFPGGRSAH